MTDYLDLIVRLVSALAWPVSVLLLAWLFRRDLQILLNRIRVVSKGDVTVEFDPKEDVSQNMVADLSTEDGDSRRDELIATIKTVSDMSNLQLRICNYLARYRPLAKRSITEISRNTNATAEQLSVELEGLESSGLVNEVSPAPDQRFQLTSKGDGITPYYSGWYRD